MTSPEINLLFFLFQLQSLTFQLQTEFSWDKKNPWVNRGGDGRFQGKEGLGSSDLSKYIQKDFNVKEAIHKGGKTPSPMEIVKGVIKGDPKVMEYPNAIVNGFKVMMDKVVNVGYNESAIKMAAQAKAFHDKHGDKAGLNLMGYSAGGMVTHEAAELLDRLGIKAKVVNLGSPWYMLTKKVGPSVTITSKQDDVMNFTPVRDALHIDSVRSHVLYFKDKEVLSFIGRFMASPMEEADDLRKNWRILSDKFDVGDKGRKIPDNTKINKRRSGQKSKESRAKTAKEESAIKKDLDVTLVTTEI